jgi:hypothetical protein
MADVAQFIELLFADQTLDQLVASLNKKTAPDQAWMFLTKAAEHIRRGETGRAAELLLELAGHPKIPTRYLLWSWATLRRLGIHPKSDEADNVKGVVIQVPIESGVDVLAAYADGTARYVNHSGKILVWEITDNTISSMIRKLLQSCKHLCGVVAAGSANDAVKDSVRVTLLTFNGNRFAEVRMQSLASSPINVIVSVGAELMANLIKRSQSMDQIGTRRRRHIF